MSEWMRFTGVWSLGVFLAIGPAAMSVAAQKPKRPTIEGCTQADLATPGAQKCLNESVLQGSGEMYVVCEADGSKKCCVGTGSDRACYDIVERKVPRPSVGPRAPSPKTAP